MTRSVLIVCDKDGRTSFGHLALSMRAVLRDAGLDAETLWLETPRYFPGDGRLPGLSLRAGSLQTGFFSFRGPFRRLLRERRPDVVLLVRPELGFLAGEVRKALPGARAGVFVHDLFAQTLYPRSPKFALINRFFVRGTESADFYLYNSEWTRSRAEARFGIAGRPGAVVGCPVDSSRFFPPEAPPSAAERAAFRELRGMEGFNGLCLTVSLAEPRKNVETFVEMAALRPRVAFARVGRPSEPVEALAARKRLRNFFQFAGLDDARLREFYRMADLYVCPSWLEGFGMTPLEALACGTPAVVARTSALEEIFADALPTVSPADDARAYVEQLDRALAGEEIVRPEAAGALLERFSPKEFGRRLLAALPEG